MRVRERGIWLTEFGGSTDVSALLELVAAWISKEHLETKDIDGIVVEFRDKWYASVLWEIKS